MNTTHICPDDIRKELTGNISDQTQNEKVFAYAYARTQDALKNGESVVFDSTGLYKPGREDFINLAKEMGATPIAVIFNTSNMVEICRNRVVEDLRNGKDRSNTIAAEHIISRQHENFLNAIKEIKNENWDSIIEV